MEKNDSLINGLAHVILSVNDWEKSTVYYRKLLSFLGLTCVWDGTGYSKDSSFLYYVGGRTAIGISPANTNDKFLQTRVGLHHLCFRAKNK